ncbi:MAG: pantoate--beta-alanine ligase [Rhodospirillales bacterium]|nr:pantoate--beta-alanine ligase [Rhodospirillales bacterium]
MTGGGGLATVRTVEALRQHVRGWRGEGRSVALVPTMGALHEGHLSLIRLAREQADRVCVSLFVNPTQFGPNEDFDRYPRDEAADAAKLAAAGAHLLFAPGLSEVYPPGHLARVHVPVLGDALEGTFRPGFFTGVATVVTKLLLMALPDAAVFGSKDYQQLLVIRRLVADLDIPVRIVAGETVREADGLALSSRNAYLAETERRIAPVLHATIVDVAEAVATGRNAREAENAGTRRLGEVGFGKIDYVAVRDAETLGDWDGPPQPGRVLVAAWLGRTRLIDNVPVPSG